MLIFTSYSTTHNVLPGSAATQLRWGYR